MKTIHFIKLCAAFVLSVALLGNLAKATPLITGIIQFDGSATTDTGNLATATAYASITDTFVFPLSTGDYASVPLFTPVTFTPFSFSAIAVTPLWTFTVGAVTYSFDATSITVNTQNGKFLNLSGNGAASITGFQTTEGTWTITDTAVNGDVFTFGASSEALGIPIHVVPVDDSGGTGLLIGLGLAGVAAGMVVQRRRLAKV